MTIDLISRRTRREFQEHLLGWALREIEALFGDDDIERDSSAAAGVSRQRRGLVAEYYATVDWASWLDMQRVLRVYLARSW